LLFREVAYDFALLNEPLQVVAKIIMFRFTPADSRIVNQALWFGYHMSFDAGLAPLQPAHAYGIWAVHLENARARE
jgi:hypothetical protein